ncbi:MAG TPA: hypothetical protein VM687_01645 [Stenotrophomonas sp.]|nr:hypothetical protein [Stenotrophomonas sp.]
MLSLPTLHRRVRRLLPADLHTVGVLPPPPPAGWEGSPLSRLALGGQRRGVLGLRLAAGFAAQVLARGLCTARSTDAGGAPRYLPWQPLPARGRFWCHSEEGDIGLLVDAPAQAAWLFWQDRRAGLRP